MESFFSSKITKLILSIIVFMGSFLYCFNLLSVPDNLERLLDRVGMGMMDDNIKNVWAQNYYYVSTTGNDDNPGTENLPWKTIQKAANTMVAGDTVKIHAGTYEEVVTPENSGEINQYITYQNYGDGEVIIRPPADSAYKTCIFLQSWARLEYLKFINLTLDNSQHVSVGQTITADTAAISGGETNDINTPQYLDKPHTNIIIDNCKIINSFVGIYFYYKAKDIQITNCVLDGNQYGIMLIDYVQNVLIENNIIRNSKQYHPTDSDGDDMRIIAFNQRYNSDITIRNNEVSDSLRQGILFTGTDNGLIEDNHTFNNGATGIQIEGADDGRMLKNVVIRNNISEHNAQRYGAETGIWVDDATNVVVENNIMRYNATGFRITGSDQVIARNNLIYENHYYGGSNKCTGTQNIGWTSAGIWTWGNATTPDGGKDHIIVHNTVYKNGNQNPCNNRPFSQISLNYNSISAANPGGYPQLSGTVFKNNISSMSNATNPATDLVVEANGVTGFSVDYNNYYSPARAAGLNVNLINANHPGNSSGGATYGWEEYKSDTGFDAHSMIIDPLFINQNSYDFNLNANSLAIDNGNFLTKANNAGNNSTSLIVQDARYFTNGYGLVEGDKIKIGLNNPASITNVDYGSNTITLAENLSWNSGDNVSYDYSGAKPDMGALEYYESTPACFSNWSCTTYGACTNGTQLRACTDANNCGTETNKPALSQSCTATPPVCTPSWSCGDWGNCANNLVTRTCTDSNSCGVNTDKPIESKSCDAPVCSPNWTCANWSVCSNNNQTRVCTDNNNCGISNNKPLESQSCRSNLIATSTPPGGGVRVINLSFPDEPKVIINSGQNINQVLQEQSMVKDGSGQAKWMNKFTSPITKNENNLSINNTYAINNFIVYGTKSTLKLGAGERAAVISSYKLVFKKLPVKENEWWDVIKMANGIMPKERNTTREIEAKKYFSLAFGRAANMNVALDNWTVSMMAYGLKEKKRDINLEKGAIAKFKITFRRNPSSANDWIVVKALSYAGIMAK